ncbi:MAG: heavy metal translocating P-type ATPase, partial [Solirubrobacteraceae bacterium]
MKVKCYHCGNNCDENKIEFDEKQFCCNGCSSVYQILNANNLSDFYALNNLPGIKPEDLHTNFKFLDTVEIFEKVVDFSDQGTTMVTFFIPVIHCSSCVWLLESLHDINQNILYSNVNFVKKTVQITFKHQKILLSEVAELVTTLGYQPRITLDNLDKKQVDTDNTLIAKIAVTGFCFGNVMLFALPEYFENYDLWLENYKPLFRWIMFLLSLPVIFYCATDYFKSAWSGIKNRIINIDIPISLGILAQFLTSIYESLSGFSSGYYDSLCGLVFFMLLGKFFQQRTYQSMSFDRDYKSFYPISVVKIENGKEKNILLSELKKGDRIMIRNMEIIPADCILIAGSANIDNSFITGESILITKKNGDKIYAGAKQIGQAITLDVINDISQSYLTDLWNHKVFKKETESFISITNLVGKYFIIAILFIALFTSFYWYVIDLGKMLQVTCSVLIVACPCALSLSVPFTLGNVMRLLGARGFYIKDTLTLERISKINHIVF